MPIVLDCPGCGKRYEVDLALAGKKSRCKQCGEVFRIAKSSTARETSGEPDPLRAGQPGCVLAQSSSQHPSSASSGESIRLEGPSDIDERRSTSRSPSAETGVPPAPTMAINCPNCGKRYELSAALCGKKSRCGQCGEVFLIGMMQPLAREPETVTMTLLPEDTAEPPPRPPEAYRQPPLAQGPDMASAHMRSSFPGQADVRAPLRPRRPARAKKSANHRDSGLGVLISGGFSVALFVLLAGAYGAGTLGLLAQSQVKGLVEILMAFTMLACGILIAWGAVWLVVIAFREETRCGWMFLFVPLYPLYYILTRLAETKGPASMVAVAYFVIIGSAILGPAIDPTNAAPSPSQPMPQLATMTPAAPPNLGGGANVAMPLAPDPAGRDVNHTPFAPRLGFGRRGGGPPGNLTHPGPPAQFLDHFANQIEAIHARYGNKAIVVVFTGIPANSDPTKGVTGREVLEAITQRIKALAPAIEYVMTFGPENQKALIIAPIDDASALASRIDFGKTTLQRDTRIRIDLSPEFVATVPRLPPEPAWVSNQNPGPSRAEAQIPRDADPVTRSLLELRSLDVGKKKEAVHRLERTAPDNRTSEVVAALLPLLSEDDGFLVNDVIRALVVWRTPDVLPALIRRANDNRFGVRKGAVKALGKFREQRAIEAIIAHLKQDGFEAEAALKEIGPMAEPALIARLRDVDPHVRRKAWDILGQIGGADTLRALRAIRTDPDLGVRMAAKRAAQEIAARVGRQP